MCACVRVRVCLCARACVCVACVLCAASCQGPQNLRGDV